MCVVSMVTDHYIRKWPTPEQFIQEWPKPEPFRPLPTIEEYKEFHELLRKAREYDKRMNQPDCPDAEKRQWLDELEQRMVEKYGLGIKVTYAPQDPDRPNQTVYVDPGAA